MNNKEPNKSTIINKFIISTIILIVLFLTFVSIFIEQTGYSSILGESNKALGIISLSIILSLVFNIAKITLTYIRVKLDRNNQKSMLITTIWATLIILSMSMTALVVSNQLGKPTAKETLKANTKMIRDNYNQKIKASETEFATSKQNLKQNYDSQIKKAEDHYQPLIVKLIEAQRVEMNKIDPKKAVWRGPRFIRYEEMIERYEAELKAATDAIMLKYDDDNLTLLKSFNKDLAILLNGQKVELSLQDHDVYANTGASQNRFYFETIQLFSAIGLSTQILNQFLIIILTLVFEITPIILMTFLFTLYFENYKSRAILDKKLIKT